MSTKRKRKNYRQQSKYTVHQLGEHGVIAYLRKRMPANLSVEVGIGDDAAVLNLSGKKRLLFASDMLVEGVHFNRRSIPAHWIGWKALACNISDIAAMGGKPYWAVVSLGMPKSTTVKFVSDLTSGLARCARKFNVAIVGGDTVRAPQVVIDVAIIGAVESSLLTLRSGAHVGDMVYVTGQLGGSSYRYGHAKFMPRLAEAQVLVKRYKISSMMDLSDGLSFDLWQLSRASRVKIQVDLSRIPVAPTAKTLNRALREGEDFELLFTVGKGAAKRLPKKVDSCSITCIGRVVGSGTGVDVKLTNGRIEPLARKGFEHL